MRKQISLLRVLFCAAFAMVASAQSVWAQNAVVPATNQGNGSSHQVNGIENNIRTLFSFNLCKELVEAKDIAPCMVWGLKNNAVKLNADGTEFVWSEEEDRGFFQRVGLPISVASQYEIKWNSGKFRYQRGTDFLSVNQLKRSPDCWENGRGNLLKESLFVYMADGKTIAVPVQGRTVLYFNGAPADLQECKTFTTHAGVALAYEFSKTPDFIKQYEEDLHKSMQGASKPIQIFMAGTLEYDSAWQKVVAITNCSGHFRPSARDFFAYLIHLNNLDPSKPIADARTLAIDFDHINLNRDSEEQHYQLQAALKTKGLVVPQWQGKRKLKDFCFKLTVAEPP